MRLDRTDRRALTFYNFWRFCRIESSLYSTFKNRAGKAILKISIFWPTVILKISKNDQISEPDQIFSTHCRDVSSLEFKFGVDGVKKKNLYMKGGPEV